MLREVVTIQAQASAPGADFLGAVAFSPDGKWLATGGTTERPKVWDVRTWKLKSELPTAEQYPQTQSLDFHPSGRLLACGRGVRDNRGHATIEVFDPAKRKLLKSFEIPATHVHGLFLPDVTRILTYGYNCRLDLWDDGSGHLFRCKKKLKGWGGPLARSADGRFAALGAGAAVSVWDLLTQTEVLVLKGHKRCVKSVGFSPTDSVLASGGADGTVRLWDTATGSEVACIAVGTGGQTVWSLKYLESGRRLALTVEGRLMILDVTTGDPVTEVEANTYFGTLAVSPDERLFAVATGHGSVVKVYEL